MSTYFIDGSLYSSDDLERVEVEYLGGPLDGKRDCFRMGIVPEAASISFDGKTYNYDLRLPGEDAEVEAYFCFAK